MSQEVSLLISPEEESILPTFDPVVPEDVPMLAHQPRQRSSRCSPVDLRYNPLTFDPSPSRGRGRGRGRGRIVQHENLPFEGPGAIFLQNQANKKSTRDMAQKRKRPEEPIPSHLTRADRLRQRKGNITEEKTLLSDY